jgi:hypothetical protein
MRESGSTQWNGGREVREGRIASAKEKPQVGGWTSGSCDSRGRNGLGLCEVELRESVGEGKKKDRDRSR